MKKNKLCAIFTTLFLLGTTYTARAAVINYTVKSGDTLWKISQSYNTTVSKITSLNNLSSSGYIYPGQVLKIEDSSTTNYTPYKVISGDTLWKISIKYNTTVNDIIKLNNLTSSCIYIGQVLNIPIKTSQPTPTPSVQTTNYKVVAGDTVWGVAQKFNTSMDAIVKSNMLALDILMPGQILTIPLNSTQIVKPIGITMMKSRVNNNYGDIYTWENARRLFTVGQKGTLKDLKTGISFNIKYYGGSNHSDIVPLTTDDSSKMKQLFPTWSWSYMRPMILTFNQGGTNYQLAVSLTGMPHSTTDMYQTNGINGHFDLYFYNSTSHVSNELSPTHQKNILIANGQ
ncbi:LysM peptidoglycan-binding domain-containing protein [Clostridium sp. MB40-C1]|uniref:LysM peptidoglycan-binding domain-containing protein n=1 Tax=Clostridium sp. MB40-C1 TaxID=3070996 RepID=UPI0027E12B04|nr:LysM peptidoglycan-binding domain-containing protein [Clostridium sp. MB40-C1]WMJ79222.1 LysM peptidoglycan-binding domain-containing protein [Clostridium sp. MB40-C1]